MTRVILASASPRRRALLAEIGLDPDVRPTHVDETPRTGELPSHYVTRIAGAKAGAAATETGDADDWVVIAADTAVTSEGLILGKPESDDDARRMLRLLSSRPHQVLTGVAVLTAGAATTDVSSSTVTMSAMSDAEVDWYVATGEPEGKAGSFAVQGIGGWFIERVDGSVSNVIGLPLTLTRRLCAEVGVDLLELARP